MFVDFCNIAVAESGTSPWYFSSRGTMKASNELYTTPVLIKLCSKIKRFVGAIIFICSQ